MSKVNFSRNIFLEKEELVRLQKFLQDDAKKFVLLNDVSTFGIVAQPSLLGADFLVQAGSTAGTFKVVNDSYAIDKDLLMLSLKSFDNYPVVDNSAWYWVRVSHRYLNAEVGTVSINTAGELSGTGTLFTEVLRSQTSKAPVKIRFYKENVQGFEQSVNNDSVYEVVSIVNNTNAVLSGDFVAESGLRYIVIGGVSLGAALTTEQKAGLYSYDNCEVILVAETVVDTPPTTLYTADKDFYIARVRNVGGTLTIQDKRTNYFATSIAISETNLKAKINYADSAICKALSDSVNAVILDGCSANLSYGSLELQAGSIYWNGEIFEVESQTVSDIGETGKYYFELDVSSIALPTRKLTLGVDTTVPVGAVQFAEYIYSVLTFNIYTLVSYLLKASNNLSEVINKSAARLNLGLGSISIFNIKIISIGDWNMDSTDYVSINHDLTVGNIRAVFALINSDVVGSGAMLNSIGINGELGGGIIFSTTQITLSRAIGGIFDSSNYDATSFNRGYIVILYS